jgi:mannose-6-phosphate isomerase-like protein (cupin superfamily)
VEFYFLTRFAVGARIRSRRVADFTKINLLGLDDLAAGRAPGLEARMGRSALETEHLGISHFRLEPGVRAPYGHHHEVQEEVYVVVSGAGRFKLDDEIIEVRQWDALRVAPTVIRGFEAGPEGLELLVVGSDRPEEGDGDIVPGWW